MWPIVIEGAGSSHWLEMASWASQILLVVAALITLILGYLQVRANTRSSQGTLLLELDARWDSSDIKAARTLISDIRTEITKAVSGDNLLMSDAAKQAKVRSEWARRLGELRANEDEKYIKLVGMMGFYETLGLMVKRNYITADDAIDLFKGPILAIDLAFRDHMVERGKEIGVPKGLFEHAFSLCDIAKKRS